jgi:hypothetical protein
MNNNRCWSSSRMRLKSPRRSLSNRT